MPEYERRPRRPGEYQRRIREAIQALQEAKGRELSKAELDAAVDLLLAKWGDERRCPYCDDPNWHIGSELLELPIKGKQAHVQVLGVECDKCGNIVLLNTDTLGLSLSDDR